MLVRTEGILTQLVFDHALRIRMKEEATPSSTSTTEANTPDTRSIVDTDAEAGSSNSGEETLEGSGDSSTVSLPQSAAKGKKKAAEAPSALPSVSSPQLDSDKPETNGKAANLVGRINNYVSTDLGNITDGRDFLFVGEFQRREHLKTNNLTSTVQLYTARCSWPFVYGFYIIS